MLLDQLLAAALDGDGSLPPHAALDTPRRACVAIVLRLAPPSPSQPAAPLQQRPFDDLAALRSWYKAQPEASRPEVEVLFIRRAINPRDRWSGQVAFPGGRSAPGEDDRSCVEREFREELGVDLNSRRFRCLGRLDDRLVRTRTPFAVATFVYLQMGEPTEFRLAPTEVAEAFWCPATRLSGPRSRIECLRLTMDSLTISASTAVRFARLLGISTLFFPCIHLRGNPDPSYALWGLSLGIVSDLLKVAGLPSFGERRAAELKDAHLGLSRHGTLPFLTDSRVMNALLPAYFERDRGKRRALWVVGGAIGVALVSVSVGLLASQRRAHL